MNHAQPSPERHTMYITFRIDTDTVWELKKYAKKHNTTMADTMRDMVHKFILENKED
jgi:NRPS condensation-like uncharacterized protein